MKQFTFTLFFLFASLVLFSQKHDVELITSKTDKAFVFKATNHSNVQQEITLTLKIQNLTGYTKPVIKLIPAKATIDVIKLYFVKGKTNKYESSYIYKPKPTNKELAERKKKLEKKILSTAGDVSKGIVVFSKDGCSRCHYATSYLLDNNIDFKFLNVSENKDYNHLMWTILKKENTFAETESVTMPVILVNGKVSYSIKDLQGFVSNLK